MKYGLLAILCGIVVVSPSFADDWPQFRGPDRTGVSKEKGLLAAWPKGGPKLVWAFKDAGLGFSTVSVVKGVVYTLGTDKKFDDEYIIALDEKKGTELWRLKIGTVVTFQGNQWGDGPRSCPTIDGAFLYALGSQGDLVCCDLAKKSIVWKKNLINDLGGKLMEARGFPDGYGYSESLLIDGNTLICTPGGPKGTLAALDKTTGKVLWRSEELKYNAPYSSAVVADFHGVRQYIQTGYHNVAGKEYGVVFGVDTKGKLLWKETMFKSQSYAIAATPVLYENKVYVTSGYGGGCHLFEIDKKQQATDLLDKGQMKKVKNNHGGVIRIGQYVYGHSDKNMWICHNLKSGDVEWDGGERVALSRASGSITSADGRLILYADDGEVGLVAADPKEFKLLSSFTIPVKSEIPLKRQSSQSAQIWTHPVVANGHLYLRDHEYIFAFDLRK